MEVAKTIITQLGHSASRMGVMVGAWGFVGSPNSLSFRFKARAKNGSNAVRIVLDPSDTYTVTFISNRGSSTKVKGEFSDVYAEDLTRLFENETGLYLSL